MGIHPATNAISSINIPQLSWPRIRKDILSAVSIRQGPRALEIRCQEKQFGPRWAVLPECPEIRFSRKAQYMNKTRAASVLVAVSATVMWMGTSAFAAGGYSANGFDPSGHA